MASPMSAGQGSRHCKIEDRVVCSALYIGVAHDYVGQIVLLCIYVLLKQIRPNQGLLFDERRRMKKSSYWRGQLRSLKVLYLLSKVALFSLSEFCGLTVVAIHFFHAFWMLLHTHVGTKLMLLCLRYDNNFPRFLCINIHMWTKLFPLFFVTFSANTYVC